MLGKTHDLGAYIEDTGEVRVKLANFAELSKVANEMEEFIASFTPDPNFMYLHVIAMGSGEYYGCNKNGDYFPEKALIMYHHTFVQNAKVFNELTIFFFHWFRLIFRNILRLCCIALRLIFLLRFSICIRFFLSRFSSPSGAIYTFLYCSDFFFS